MHQQLAFAPRDYVDGVDSGGERDFVAGGVETVGVAEVLLVLVDDFNVLTVGALLVEDDADEVNADGLGVLEVDVEGRARLPLV